MKPPKELPDPANQGSGALRSRSRPPVEPPESPDLEGSLIRSATRPEIYVVENGRRRWIPDAATLESKWSWSQVQVVTGQVLNSIPLGPPYPSVLQVVGWPDGTLLQAGGRPEIYVVRGGQRHQIPNPQTFIAGGFRAQDIRVISEPELNAVPLGDPIPPVSRFIVDTGNAFMGAGHWMNTRAGITLSTGAIAATTRIWTQTWFGGFHGAVGLVLTDADQLPLGPKIVNRYGVDGTAIGTSDRTEPWFGSIDPAEAQKVVRMDLFHTWAPDDFQTILDKWVQTGGKIATLVGQAAQVAASVTAIAR